MTTYDVVVCGAGIIGCSIAAECADRGLTVAIVDPHPSGFGASSIAAGMLIPYSEADGDSPALALGRVALRQWHRFAPQLEAISGVSIGFGAAGTLRAACSEGAAAELRNRLPWLAQSGITGRWCGAEDVRAIEPQAADFTGAIWFPDEARVNPSAVMRALFITLQHGGVAMLRGTRVQSIDPRGTLLLTDGSQLQTPQVVLAAGAWTEAIAPLFTPHRVTTPPIRGQLLHATLATPLRATLFAGADGYALTHADGTTVIGATQESVGFDATITASATKDLLAMARRLLHPTVRITGIAHHVGLRPGPSRAGPTIGPVESTSTFPVLIATGHFRTGILLAPTTAQLIADMITGIKPDPIAEFCLPAT